MHGHNYWIDVTVCGSVNGSGPKLGMIVDFSDLNRIVKPIIEQMDHINILNDVLKEDLQWQRHIANLRDNVHLGVERMLTPTAEVIAEFIHFKVSQDGFFQGLTNLLGLHTVTVWETDDCSATYTEHGYHD